MPAGDANLLDEKSREVLFLNVVELVDDAADPAGEVVHAASELVVAGQRAAFLGEVCLLFSQVV